MDTKLTILAVDDEPVVLESIERHLRKEPYNLQTAKTARAAVGRLEEGGIDIVLTDLMMPEIDGLELLKLIKARTPELPVIMITGYATINSALEATNLGAFDYIAKPFTKQELLSVIHRASELVAAKRNQGDNAEPAAAAPSTSPTTPETRKAVGEYGWTKLQDDGTVLLGVGQVFLESIGKVQNVFLPAVGDQLRQGGVYLRVFSTDMRSHTVLSPLSGVVVEINEKIAGQPLNICEHPSESCWLIRLKPSKFDLEIKELGLEG